MQQAQWMSFFQDMYHRFIEDEITALAAQLAYFLILAVFPFLIFLLALLAYTPLTIEMAYDFVRILPTAAADTLVRNIMEISSSRNYTLLSFSMIATLWAASTGFNAIIRGINRAYKEKETRPFWKLLLISLVSTILLAVVSICALFMLVLGRIIGEDLFALLGLSTIFAVVWQWIRWVLPFSIMLLVFILMYRYTPDRNLSFQEVLPGAIFATVGWGIASAAFSYYVNEFGRYAQIYGSIGGIIILLVWLYLCSIIILLGGEINASLASMRK